MVNGDSRLGGTGRGICPRPAGPLAFSRHVLGDMPARKYRKTLSPPQRGAIRARGRAIVSPNKGGEADDDHAAAAFRVVPLRARGNPRDESADLHRRLPLSRLPEDVVERLLADGHGAGRRLGGYLSIGSEWGP